jgi:hypothetical protein
MSATETAAERLRLFTEILPKWERRITYVSHLTIQTRTIDIGLLGVEDIENELRMSVWKAVESWDPERGASLSTWIFNAINQGKSLIVESQYHKVPRDENGHPKYPVSIDAEKEIDTEGEEVSFQLEDPFAVDKVTEFAEEEWFRDCCKTIKEVLSSNFEGNVFNMILSGNYDTDQSIADELEVDFAVVSEVRLKAKVAFALLNNIPLEAFTRAKNAEAIAKKLQPLLKV